MVTCLDLYYVILRPSEKTYPRAIYIPKHCGIPNAYRFFLQECKIHKFVYIFKSM